MGFGVAYGLGLQGLKQARLHTNLLPHEVRVERLVRGKKPWAAAAAACLLVAIAGLAMAKGIEKSHVSGDDIKKSLEEAKRVQEAVTRNNSAFAAEETRIKQSKENLDKLGAGTKERLNWQLLHEYINYALPLANGDRLVERAQNGAIVKGKFKNKDADIAFAKLEARRFPKLNEVIDKKKAAEDDQFIKRHLIQVNVEGVMELYSDDLQPYFRFIHGKGDALFGMDNAEKNQIIEFVAAKDQDAKDKAKLPKTGWVVEVRGYTYHMEEMVFVMLSFLENLRQPEYARKPEWKEFKDWLSKQPEDAQKRILSTAELTRELGPPELVKLDKSAKSDKVDKEEKGEKAVEIPAKFKQLVPALAMDELIRKKLSYLFVYKQKKVLNPEAGKFELIGHSELRDLVKGLDEAGAAGDKKFGFGDMKGQALDGKDKGAADVAKPSRDGWNPIGEIAVSVFGGGGGGGFGGGFGGGGVGPPGVQPGGLQKMRDFGPGKVGAKDPPPAAGGGNLQPRTEFVLLFVCSEPLPTQATPAATEDKK
jgi:hypothetical protein